MDANSEVSFVTELADIEPTRTLEDLIIAINVQGSTFGFAVSKSGSNQSRHTGEIY